MNEFVSVGFQCKEVQDSTFTNLVEVIGDPFNFVTEVLLPRNISIQQSFIERIRFLIEQHDFVYELHFLKERDVSILPGI